MLVQLVKR